MDRLKASLSRKSSEAADKVGPWLLAHAATARPGCLSACIAQAIDTQQKRHRSSTGEAHGPGTAAASPHNPVLSCKLQARSSCRQSHQA